MQMSRLSQLQRRWFAWCMATINAVDQQAVKCTGCFSYDNMAAYKQGLLGNLSGTVLEIGPGTGANFIYYPADLQWIGIEPNPFMHHPLQAEAMRQGLQDIQLYTTSAEALPMENDSIDTVVSTHVLCSVTHLQPVFQEILRVLKPGGMFTFFEHVGAPTGTWNRVIQNSVTPLWKLLFDGCYPNRETWCELDKAGFTSIDYNYFSLRLPVVSPHIAGVAVK